MADEFVKEVKTAGGRISFLYNPHVEHKKSRVRLWLKSQTDADKQSKEMVTPDQGSDVTKVHTSKSNWLSRLDNFDDRNTYR